MDSIVTKTKNIYGDTDDEAQFSRDIDEICKYSIASELHTGLTTQDASTQSDQSDLLPLQELVGITGSLTRELEAVKKDMEVKLKFLVGQYESQLEREAHTLYTRLNQKSRALEKSHKDKVTVLRQSFQQQLTDALLVVRADCRRFYQVKRVTAKAGGSTHTKNLMMELQEKTQRVEELEELVADYESRLLLSQGSSQAMEPETDWLKEEYQSLQEEINNKDIELELLQGSLTARERQAEELIHVLKDVRTKAEEQEKARYKMADHLETLQAQLSFEREKGKQKQLEMKDQMVRHTKNTTDDSKLTVEKELQEEPPRKENNKQATAVEVADKLINKENEELRKALEKLQRRLERTNLMWGKRLEVMKLSYHTIKDEMFLRQRLQRQAADLHQASVTYTPRAPGWEGPYRGVCAPLPAIGEGLHRTREHRTVPESQGERRRLEEQEQGEGERDYGNEEMAQVIPLLPPPYPAC